MTRQHSVTWLFLFALLGMTAGAHPVHADDVVLISGETLTGKLQGERLSIETTGGRVEANFDVIAHVDIESPDGVHVELVDGTSFEGRLIQEEIILRQGLLDRVLAASSVKRLVWSPPSVTLPAGTPVRLALVRSISSAAAKVGDAVSLCTTESVQVEGKVVIDRHAPGSGSVLGTGGGSNVSGGGSLVLRAGTVIARDGTTIMMTGNLEARGGFDGANWGLVGLLSEGSPAVAASGMVFEARVADDVSVGTSDAEFSSEQRAAQDLCTDYFRFSDAAEIPLDQVEAGRAYATVLQPLRLSAPLLELARSFELDGTPLTKKFPVRAFATEGVRLTALSVEAIGKRKRGGVLDLAATIAVPPSHDRWVSLTFELYADEKKVKTFRRQRIDAEERKVTPVKGRIELSREEADEILRATDPRLRITMTVINN